MMMLLAITSMAFLEKPDDDKTTKTFSGRPVISWRTPCIGRSDRRISDEPTGKERVFFDKYHEAEILRLDMDTYLQNIYHNDCELLVVFLCEAYERKDWCHLEWRAIKDLIKARRNDDIVLVRIDDCEIPGIFSTDGCIDAKQYGAEKIAALILDRLDLNTSQADRPRPETPTTGIPPQQRQREIDWLQNILKRRFPGITSLYVNLESEQRQQASLAKILPSELMPTTFIFRSSQIDRDNQSPAEPKKYSDILHAFHELSQKQNPRLAVLGEPGAGKTFTLIRILLDYAEQALGDVIAPIPLYLPLGRWTQEDQSLEDFVNAELGDLGTGCQGTATATARLAVAGCAQRNTHATT